MLIKPRAGFAGLGNHFVGRVEKICTVLLNPFRQAIDLLTRIRRGLYEGYCLTSKEFADFAHLPTRFLTHMP